MKKKPPIRLSISNTLYEVSIELRVGAECVRICGPSKTQDLGLVEIQLIQKYLIAEGFVRSRDVRIE